MPHQVWWRTMPSLRRRPAFTDRDQVDDVPGPTSCLAAAIVPSPKTRMPSPRRQQPIYQGTPSSCPIHPVRDRPSHPQLSRQAKRASLTGDAVQVLSVTVVVPVYSVAAGPCAKAVAGPIPLLDADLSAKDCAPPKDADAVPTPIATDLPRDAVIRRIPSGPRPSVTAASILLVQTPAETATGQRSDSVDPCGRCLSGPRSRAQGDQDDEVGMRDGLRPSQARRSPTSYTPSPLPR